MKAQMKPPRSPTSSAAHRLHRCSRLHGSRVCRRILSEDSDRPWLHHQRAEDTAAPGTYLLNLVAELLGLAANNTSGLGERLRAVVVADGPNVDDQAAIGYAADHGSDRLYVVDPWLKVLSGTSYVDQPSSARVAGLIAKVDAERGFWESSLTS